MNHSIVQLFGKALKQLCIAALKMLLIVFVWSFKLIALIITKLAETVERIVLKNA
jgi:hypothetical protein